MPWGIHMLCWVKPMTPMIAIGSEIGHTGRVCCPQMERELKICLKTMKIWNIQGSCKTLLLSEATKVTNRVPKNETNGLRWIYIVKSENCVVVVCMSRRWHVKRTGSYRKVWTYYSNCKFKCREDVKWRKVCRVFLSLLVPLKFPTPPCNLSSLPYHSIKPTI